MIRLRFIWFLSGFAVCLILVVLASWYLDHKSDCWRERLPRALDELDRLAAQDPTLAWLYDAEVLGTRFHQFVFPTRTNNASAMLRPRSGFPMVHFMDEDENGVVDTVDVQDSKLRGVNLKDSNGNAIFDHMAYSDGHISNSTLYVDSNMDGLYDIRMVSNSLVLVRLGSEWYELHKEEGRRIVYTSGGPKEVVKVHGIYRFRDELEADGGESGGNGVSP
jgi:hypothetical protein